MDSVIEDSRCPVNVYCKWEGNAKVKFALKIKDKNTEFNLDTHDRYIGENQYIFTNDTVIQNYHIEMTKLDPYPVNTVITDQKDYSSAIIITKFLK